MLGRRTGERRTSNLRRVALVWVLVIGSLVATSSIRPAFSQAKAQGCECDFSDPQWKARGTNAACSVLMHPGRKSCEIQFAGIGANPNLISKVLGRDPKSYRDETFEVINIYFQYLRDNRRDSLSDPKFITRALPVLMRGAYLSGSSIISDSELVQIIALDKAVIEFLEKYSATVSNVFLNKQAPFRAQVDAGKFEVGNGSIVVDHPAGLLITIYIPPAFGS